MSDSFNKLKTLINSARSSEPGETMDIQWLYKECQKVFAHADQFDTRKIDRSLIQAGRTMNNMGEHALAKDVFEKLLQRTRKSGEDKLQLDSIEGLALAQFHLGEYDAAYRLVEEGAGLAINLRNDKWTILFKRMKADFLSGSVNLSK